MDENWKTEQFPISFFPQVTGIWHFVLKPIGVPLILDLTEMANLYIVNNKINQFKGSFL